MSFLVTAPWLTFKDGMSSGIGRNSDSCSALKDVSEGGFMMPHCSLAEDPRADPAHTSGITHPIWPQDPPEGAGGRD